jgi:hypothetical protein
VLAGGQGGLGHRQVQVVRRADVHQVDVVAGDDGPPIGAEVPPAPPGGEGPKLGGVAAADGV